MILIILILILLAILGVKFKALLKWFLICAGGVILVGAWFMTHKTSTVKNVELGDLTHPHYVSCKDSEFAALSTDNILFCVKKGDYK